MLIHFRGINRYSLKPKDVVFFFDDMPKNNEVTNTTSADQDIKTNHMGDFLKTMASLKVSNNNKDIVHVPSPPRKTLNIKHILRALAGVKKLHKHVIIFTTNSPIDDMDSKFTRPGRITLLLKFDKCSKDITVKTFESWWEKKCTEEQLEQTPHKKYTKAELISMCDKCDSLEEVYARYINAVDDP